MTTNPSPFSTCGGADHTSRRRLLKAAGCSGLAWLTSLGDVLALDAEKAPRGKPAKSVIFLYMAGAPSQLETFDPHPGSPIAYGTEAIATAAKGIQIAKGLEQTATVMGDVSLVRSVVSKEGDHERATYNIKTGFRPNPSVVHPSIGAVICHELDSSGVEIPTHISILPNRFAARGGYLGAKYDAFSMYDPAQPVPDVSPRVSDARQDKRLEALDVVEAAFQAGRPAHLDDNRTLHRDTMARARRMMTSDQVKAFDISLEPEATRAAFGDSPFGRGCLAALRLVEAGARCIEITLPGWDTHINNHELHAKHIATLDPAFAALILGLKERGLFDSTVVLWGGEFGRTPKLNALEGRDHWPNGFTLALAGGGFKGGRVLGATDPNGENEHPDNPVGVDDIHATIQHALGIDPATELMTPAGRPMALSDGKLLHELLA